jgi:hypothetical protein
MRKEACSTERRPVDRRRSRGTIAPAAREPDRRRTKDWDGAPLYSHDGRYIAYSSQATPGYESDLKRLALYDARPRARAT